MNISKISISKEELLKKLQEKIEGVKNAISIELQRVGKVALRPESEVLRLRKGEREHAQMLRAEAIIRYKELQAVTGSPFFFKCVIEHKTQDIRHQSKREIYFGKHELGEQGIYSWIAPIAVVRFANPGKTTFKLPNGNTRDIELHEKEQYMIVDGKVMFYSHESQTQARELIYQEHFSIKKGAFILPEIVEVMEKAQDDVIRASYFGPFAIAGPAGSGKTTLALHRVAYLVQAPEHAELYPANSIIVFVQDSGTKDYFSHLLPELGINNVKITTFFEWASEILKLENVSFIQNTECEIDKLILKNKLKIDEVDIKWNKNVFATLSNLYEKFGSDVLVKSFNEQKKRGVLDRLDITLALMFYKKHKGKLQIETESNRAMRMGRIVRHTQVETLDYSLVVVDEFQNYLPEQLNLFRSCIKEKTQSIIYVGDISQKIQHGTIQTWNDFNEEIAVDRQIRLHKVYRNTKQILNFIGNLGYKVEIPESLKEGPEVCEKIISSNTENVDVLVKELVDVLYKTKPDMSVGILSFDKVLLENIKSHSELQNKDISCAKFLTIAESQGVEFDIVCLIGVSKDMFKLIGKYEEFPEFKKEKMQMYKDLLYIALTRPMLEMNIFGNCYLKDVLKEMQ